MGEKRDAARKQALQDVRETAATFAAEAVLTPDQEEAFAAMVVQEHEDTWAVLDAARLEPEAQDVEAQLDAIRAEAERQAEELLDADQYRQYRETFRRGADEAERVP